jgi:AcrR family transcriptional regulator
VVGAAPAPYHRQKRNSVPERCELYGTMFRLDKRRSSVSGDTTVRGDGPGRAETQGRPARRVRADAQRNIDALLDAAKAVFADSGVHAPVREIAERAGVGLGTVYRHFPQRSDLVTAVFRHEVDACAEAAPVLAAEHEPGEALARWLHRYTGFIATKRGLAAALHSGDSAFDALPAYFQQHLRPALGSLLESAAAAGEVRADVEPSDLLRAVANLCLPAADDAGHSQRMVALLIDGLRYGGATASTADSRSGSDD